MKPDKKTKKQTTQEKINVAWRQAYELGVREGRKQLREELKTLLDIQENNCCN